MLRISNRYFKSLNSTNIIHHFNQITNFRSVDNLYWNRLPSLFDYLNRASNTQPSQILSPSQPVSSKLMSPLWAFVGDQKEHYEAISLVIASSIFKRLKQLCSSYVNFNPNKLGYRVSKGACTAMMFEFVMLYLKLLKSSNSAEELETLLER